MKVKFTIFVLCFCFIFFAGCKSQPTLDGYVSELRSNCYESVDSDINVSAGYGFMEKLPNLDGAINQKTYVLIFRIQDTQTENITYNISLNYQGKTYDSTFKLHPVAHTLTAIMEVDKFNVSEFEITLSFSSTNQTIKMKSTLPKGTISHSKALSYLQKHQPELVKSYYQNGSFSGEICLRVIVKDNHSYWYVGLTNHESTKALLIDGFSGEVLAVRDIF